MNSRRGLLEVGKVVLTVVLTVIIIRTFVFQVFQVEGGSMDPTFHNNEYLIVEKVSYRFHNPHRGDVVVFRYPNNPQVNYIKRIIGLPGEVVSIERGHVSINGSLIREDYLPNLAPTRIDQEPERAYQVTLAAGEYFVMGDNRDHSSDSREWGPLKEEYIVGRTSIVIYPRQDFKAVASPKY